MKNNNKNMKNGLYQVKLKQVNAFLYLNFFGVILGLDNEIYTNQCYVNFDRQIAYDLDSEDFYAIANDCVISHKVTHKVVHGDLVACDFTKIEVDELDPKEATIIKAKLRKTILLALKNNVKEIAKEKVKIFTKSIR